MKTSFKLTEKDYRYLFENSSDAMWVHDLKGNFLDANKAFERLSGRPLDDWFNNSVIDFIAPETLLIARDIKRKILAGEDFEQPYQQRFVLTDGSVRIVQMSTSPVIIDGEIIGFQHVGRDVTRERFAEQLLETIIDSFPIATFIIDKDHRITHWNMAMQSFSGLERQDMIDTENQWRAFYRIRRMTLADVAVDGSSADVIEELYNGKCRKLDSTHDAFEGEVFFSLPGTRQGKWMLLNACTLKNEAGEVIGAIETIQDISEEKSLQENMRFYGQLILRAQEDERKRIARELHDDTSSAMLILLQKLNVMETDESIFHSEQNREKFEALRSQALDVLESLRHCAQELRPRILDDLGLIAAIEWIADDLTKQSDILTSVAISGQERSFPVDNQLLLFRIIQEALSNVRRHAGAKKATITMDYGEEKLSVTIADNGQGFNLPDRIEDFAVNGHLGIMGMSERARLIGGSITVHTSRGRGTEIIINVPYQSGGRFSSLLNAW